MSKQVNIHAAKTHFSQLVEEVEAGGEVIIARAGKPILKLVKLEDDEKIYRRIGFMKGQIHIPDMDAFMNSDADTAMYFDPEEDLR